MCSLPMTMLYKWIHVFAPQRDQMQYYPTLSLAIYVLYVHIQVELGIVYGFSNDLSSLLLMLVSLCTIWVSSQEKCFCYIKKTTSWPCDVQYANHRTLSIKHQPYLFWCILWLFHLHHSLNHHVNHSFMHMFERAYLISKQVVKAKLLYVHDVAHHHICLPLHHLHWLKVPC